jgi:hypothetical protein
MGVEEGWREGWVRGLGGEIEFLAGFEVEGAESEEVEDVARVEGFFAFVVHLRVQNRGRVLHL